MPDTTHIKLTEFPVQGHIIPPKVTPPKCDCSCGCTADASPLEEDRGLCVRCARWLYGEKSEEKPCTPDPK